MVKREDGTVTGSWDEIDELVRKAWEPIVAKHKGKEPDWAVFFERYKKYIKKHPMKLEELTGKRLKKATKKWKARNSAGADSVLVEEIRNQPDWLWDDLAQLFTIVEDTGEWPEVILSALGSLIPKAPGKTKALELSPVTLMSLLYRLWGAARIEELMAWQLEWIPDGLRGFRKDAGTADINVELALKIEAAVATGETLVGVSFDYSKCFDPIPWSILFGVLEESGLHPRLLGPLRTMYTRLRRRWKIGRKGVGQEWSAANGILQGCGIPVVLLNCLVAVWLRAVEEGAEKEDEVRCGE